MQDLVHGLLDPFFRCRHGGGFGSAGVVVAAGGVAVAESLLPRRHLLGFVDAFEDVGFVADGARGLDGGDFVAADEDALCRGAAAFEHEGKVVEGHGDAADSAFEGHASGEFEGVVEADGDVAYVDEDVDADWGGVQRGEGWFGEARVLKVLLLRLMIAYELRDESGFAFLWT